MGTFITLPVYNSTLSAIEGYNSYSTFGIIQIVASNLYVKRDIPYSTSNDCYFALLSDATEYSNLTGTTLQPGRRFQIMGIALSNNPFTIKYYRYDDEGYFVGNGESFNITVNGNSYYSGGFYRATSSSFTEDVYCLGIYDGLLNKYSNISDFISDCGVRPITNPYPITYRLTNCTAPLAPVEAGIGETVNVPFSFSDGYGFINPSTDVYVMNNGVLVPSTYSNGVLSFTMPDPS